MSQVEESAPSPRLQRTPHSLFISAVIFLTLLFVVLYCPILGTIDLAPAILATGTKVKARHPFSSGSASEGASSRPIRTALSSFDLDLHVLHWIVEERSGLHITSAPPRWNSGSNQKVDLEVPRKPNPVSVPKFQKSNSCPPYIEWSKVRNADENEQEEDGGESRSSKTQKLDLCGGQRSFPSSVSSLDRTPEIEDVQHSTQRDEGAVIERKYDILEDELRARGCENAAETLENRAAGAGGDDGGGSDGDDSDSEDKRNSNDKRQRQAEFGPQKGSPDSDKKRSSSPHQDYLESPTSSRSSENHSLETDDVDDIDDLGVKLLGYDDMKQATNDFDEDNKRLLGSGSFGKVYLGDLNLRGKDVAVAVKRYKPPKNDRPSTVRLTKRQFSSEMKALSRCQHPNIISVIAYCIDGPELCMAYELIRGGTLREALSKNNPNPPRWKDRLFIVQDLSDALNYLHGIEIIHRDVKTANILLKNDDVERVTAKLADFGLSTFWDCDKSYVSTTVMVGSRSYMPPEAFLGILSMKVDVYALGMVFYEIVTGLPPYSYAKKMDLITYMKDAEKEGYTEAMIDPRIEWCKNLPGHLLELAELCSAMDRRKRPSMDEVLSKMRKPKFL